MSDKKKAKGQVTLKRRVSIKAVVTDKFKEYLRFELSETVRGAKERITAIDTQLKSESEGSSLYMQLQSEKDQLTQTVSQSDPQKSMIDNLQNETLFSQGIIDGFVSVSVGDNLYEKLGGMEITVKDGVIQKITSSVSSPNLES